MALTAFILVVGGVTVYSFTATPIYEARTRLLIEAEQQNVVNFKQVVEEDRRRSTTTRRSTTSCRAARWRAGRLDELRLWDRAPFGGDGTESLIGRLAEAPAAIARLFTFGGRAASGAR